MMADMLMVPDQDVARTRGWRWIRVDGEDQPALAGGTSFLPVGRCRVDPKVQPE